MIVAKLFSLLHPSYEARLCYMLQASEYHLGDFWSWWRSVHSFRAINKRGGLVKTTFGRLLYLLVGGMSLLLVMVAVGLGFVSFKDQQYAVLGLSLVLLASRPMLVTIWAVLIVRVGKKLYIGPALDKKVSAATLIFGKHPAAKIAVLGSYGKTTMKELLNTVLGHGLTVAATPATKNVAVSHAAFANTLTGSEDVIVVEFGEGDPGDTKLFTDMFQPDWAVVTGLAPAHLDHYGSLQAVADDFAYVLQEVSSKRIFANADSKDLAHNFPSSVNWYSHRGIGAAKVGEIQITADATSFVLRHKNQVVNVRSGLLGRHQVGPLAAVAMIGLKLGISPELLAEGFKLTKPFEHRMEPKNVHGALLIDDTYNGNIEGIAAGVALLKELPAARKLYVTPGLVEQGDKTTEVHEQIGRMLAEAAFDEVYLIRHSVTEYILAGLESKKYTGNVTIVDDPVEFYQNLSYQLAEGDIALLQNDWPDRYQ